jgi:ABC-type antimicrobial peptide transport system permease subunit
VDAAQPVTRLATMEQVVATSTAQRRLARLLFVAFALAALALSAAGIYGVLAARVAERTREIGVRSALGALPRDILRLIAVHGVRLAGLGLVAGLAGALLLRRFLERLLFGVTPTDPRTLGGVALVLAAVAVAACLVPAMRALRVSPMEVLRGE